MLRAEDLMVGDKVLLFGDKPVKVDCIGNVEVYLSDENGINWRVAYEHIKPIPLTQEILLKNGFENDFYEDVSVADYHSIRVEGYSLKGKADGWDDFLITFCNGSVNVVTDFHGEFRGEIRYVHIFQHALRLCGINLEINI